MITRIVKLEFEKSKIEQFIVFFDTIKNKVNSFPGCNGMRLHRDLDNPNIVMTYSQWDSQESLDNYRESETFGQVWPKIKPWFANKPEAWSVSTYFDGFESK
tara:strand:+ start:786 stop:1091 length:306 start_codon:yes stop_codon:yes gene_type:complete